jgi:hypothetical protein
MNRLAIRALLEMGRDAIAKKCGYEAWDAMRDELGVGGAKDSMVQAIDGDQEHHWQSKASSIIDLVVDTNTVRTGGNSSAHDCEPDEVKEAVESITDERKRNQLEELYNYVFH